MNWATTSFSLVRPLTRSTPHVLPGRGRGQEASEGEACQQRRECPKSAPGRTWSSSRAKT
eukprot:6704150-Prymnesium_polylepis.1